jgi:GDPmannose 4,6-dehydratase
MPSALITGVTGQDGTYLADLLLSKNYTVYGLVSGQKNYEADLLAAKRPEIIQLRGDLTDSSSIASVLYETQPDEIYNLGAMSFVGLSFTQPELTANVTGLGVLRLLEACRVTGLEKKVRIYQASSSEMFGRVRETPQSEITPFYPRSPYGSAKAFAHHTCVNYRDSYSMFISCGILFNHESERRGEEFVTRKISKSVARIKLGLANELRLGDLTPRRDWGHAEDYVEAMWLMLQHNQPDDFVIATGESHSVEEFVDSAFKAAGIPNGRNTYVKSDDRFKRPAEVDLLIGDPSKALKILGWKHKVSFEELVTRMVNHDINLLSKN